MMSITYVILLNYCYRHVVLPKELVKLVPKTHLMTEEQWRSIGVQQSQGWVHYMTHSPGIIYIFKYLFLNVVINVFPYVLGM